VEDSSFQLTAQKKMKIGFETQTNVLNVLDNPQNLSHRRFKINNLIRTNVLPNGSMQGLTEGQQNVRLNADHA
jgi:hypothetical protein